MTGRFDPTSRRSCDCGRAGSGGRGLALLIGALVLASSTQVLAQAEPPAPAAGQVWGGCVLNEDAVDALGAAGASVDYVVVYSRSNPHDGQPVGAGFTGPVICINPDRVGITAFDENGGLLTPETNIPADTDPGGAETVELLAAEEALVLQYQPHEGSEADREKRFCQTVGGATDCFRIFPAD